MKIIVGSKNKAKMNAVQAVFQGEHIQITAVNIASGVSPQPFSDEETIKGARNRAYNALEVYEGDIAIGLEGGVHETEHGLFLCNWGVLAEKGLPPIIAGGARIPLPDEVAEKLFMGEELGPVMESFSEKRDVRQGEGAIGIFTNGYMNRSYMFTHIVQLLAGQYEHRKMGGIRK